RTCAPSACYAPALAALLLRQIGGSKLGSKEMGLVFEFAFCGVRLPGCVGKCGRRAGVVSGRPRGAARRQRGDFRFACGVPTARLVATRSELLVATRYALGRDLPRIECGRSSIRRRGHPRAAFDGTPLPRL